MVLLKPLVLDGDGGLLQILGDVLQIRPNAVLRVQVQRLVHDPFAGVGILAVQLRGHLRFELVQIDLHLTPHGAVDIRHEDTGEDGQRHHEYQQQCADDPPGLPPAVFLLGRHIADTLLRLVLHAPRALLRFRFYVPGALPDASHKVGGRRPSALVLTQDRAPSFLFDVPVVALYGERHVCIPTQYKRYSTIPVNCKKRDFLLNYAFPGRLFPLFSPVFRFFSPAWGINCRTVPLAFFLRFGYTMGNKTKEDFP